MCSAAQVVYRADASTSPLPLSTGRKNGFVADKNGFEVAPIGWAALAVMFSKAALLDTPPAVTITC